MKPMSSDAFSVASGQSGTGGLISTGTPGNFTSSEDKPIRFTTEFIERLNQSGRELDEVIAQVTGKK